MKLLEKTELHLGFVPLTDSAPLVVAQAMGFFEEQGVRVTLHKQNSWATLRDKLHAGMLDSAQMLAPMPFASTMGKGCYQTPVITPLVLSLNGNAITLSENLYRELLDVHRLDVLPLPLDAALLSELIERRRRGGESKLRFAHVFPYSCHYYQLCDWLSAGGIVEEDVDILTIPPVNMVGFLESGEIDGFCVGGPWNAKAVRAGIGITALTSYDIWEDMPEKVLGFTEQFLETNPRTVLAVSKAILSACQWLETIPNRFEAARLLSSASYLDAPLDVIAPSLIGSCLTHAEQAPRSVTAYNRFFTQGNVEVNSPSKAAAQWIMGKMLSASQVSSALVKEFDVTRVFRDDLYQEISTEIVR